MRICVCTTNAALAEPRAPRHAVALAQMSGDYEVCFVDCAPLGAPQRSPAEFAGFPNLRHLTHRYTTRKSGVGGVTRDCLRHKLERVLSGITGTTLDASVSARTLGLGRQLSEFPADLYVAHNIDSLPLLYRLARKRGAMLVFDSMEFHSDMGDGQSSHEQKLIRRIESRALPYCRLVLTSSPELADALAREYGLENLLPLYNVPPLKQRLPEKRDGGFSLYWRNAVIGLGQRGLDDVLRALLMLPGDITLHLQGRLQGDGGAQLRNRLSELGVEKRVMLHPPFYPDEAVSAASAYTVGLCLERSGVRNHDLTVSNKIFDYLMAGLVVVASDLDGLSSVIRRSGGGVLFRSGDVEDLARNIKRLYEDPATVAAMSRKARHFALREGNREAEMLKLQAAFSAMLHSPARGSSRGFAAEPAGASASLRP
jgi:glycosyltransferase involved in cell wall biosynthesis